MGCFPGVKACVLAPADLLLSTRSLAQFFSLFLFCATQSPHTFASFFPSPLIFFRLQRNRRAASWGVLNKMRVLLAMGDRAGALSLEPQVRLHFPFRPEPSFLFSLAALGEGEPFQPPPLSRNLPRLGPPFLFEQVRSMWNHFQGLGMVSVALSLQVGGELTRGSRPSPFSFQPGSF